MNAKKDEKLYRCTLLVTETIKHRNMKFGTVVVYDEGLKKFD